MLKVTGKVLERIGELKTLYTDPTKNSDDLANYDAEFAQLQDELTSLASESFNGVALFGSSNLSIPVSEDGSSSVTITGKDLTDSSSGIGTLTDTAVADLGDVPPGGAWWGIVVPAGTQREIVARIYQELAVMLKAPDTREKFLVQGSDPFTDLGQRQRLHDVGMVLRPHPLHVGKPALRPAGRQTDPPGNQRSGTKQRPKTEPFDGKRPGDRVPPHMLGQRRRVAAQLFDQRIHQTDIQIGTAPIDADR